MLEKYKDKYVKVLVASDSGIALTGDINRYVNSLIIVFGTVSSYDNKFLELSNTTMVYYNGMGPTVENQMTLAFDNVRQPSAFENKSSILNLDKVISISIIE